MSLSNLVAALEQAVLDGRASDTDLEMIEQQVARAEAKAASIARANPLILKIDRG